MKKSIFLLPIIVVFIILCTNCKKSSITINNEPEVIDKDFNPGLIWTDGIEPGRAVDGEAPVGNTNWYVDANAPDGGDGSYEKPFNSFEEVVGYTDPEHKGYVPGLIRGGDYLYVKGVFSATGHVEHLNKRNIYLARSVQGGSVENPTVIKSWPGESRAVFDGEGILRDLIYIRNFDEQKVVIQNVEVRNAYGRGIYIGEKVRYADIINVTVCDGIGDGILGVGGGIMCRMYDVKSEFIIRNSLIYNNCKEQIGGDLNVGGISILSEGTAPDGSNIEIYDNIIYNEKYAIRHKHSGNITMHAHHNLIYNSLCAFYLRSYFMNDIHNNIIITTKDPAFLLGRDNLQGNMSVKIRNNTIVNSGGLIISTPDKTYFMMNVVCHSNIYSSMTTNNVITLGKWTSNTFDIGWEGSNNIYEHPNSEEFLIKKGNPFAFSRAMKELGETLSLSSAPGFVDKITFDLRLRENSIAIGGGVDGIDAGALSYGEDYIVHLNEL